MPETSNAAVMVTDRGYMPSALFVAHQLLSQRSRTFDVLILTIDCAPVEQGLLDPSLQFIEFHLDERAPQLSSRLDRSAATYGRLGLDSVLPDRYERILYLDADIWIGDREISPLFETDMQGCPIAAVRASSEIIRAKTPEWIDYKHRLSMESTPYFNAGVLLIDRNRFAERRIAEHAIQYLAEGRYVGKLDDQSALNAVVRGDWLELSPVWNWTFNGRPLLTAKFDPAIIHFVGRCKPWSDRKGRYPALYRNKMREYLSSIGYPDYVQTVPFQLELKRRAVICCQSVLESLDLDRRGHEITAFMRENALDLPRKARAATTSLMA